MPTPDGSKTPGGTDTKASIINVPTETPTPFTRPTISIKRPVVSEPTKAVTPVELFITTPVPHKIETPSITPVISSTPTIQPDPKPTVTIDSPATTPLPKVPLTPIPVPSPAPTPSPSPMPTQIIVILPLSTPTPTPLMPTPMPPIPTPAATIHVTVVRITNIDKVAEIVTIKNDSGISVNLTGWYLISKTGNQRFSFPEGFTLGNDETVNIISGRSAQHNPPGELLWSRAYVWNNTESDPGELYNANDQLASTWNG